MDTNIHIDDKDIGKALLEYLSGSTIEISLYSPLSDQPNYYQGELRIKDEYGRELTKVIHIEDNRI